MATLVLTAVGTLAGGPIGGAIGAVLGQQADRRLLAPKGRQGPRLGDLAVQTSSYGSAIPKLFGTMRVAGTVIWATDLREEAHGAGGGKSGGKTTHYSYSASFAVALSARPILGVGRIWADGKLLRGSAGDWKSEGAFRLHHGGEDQAADPLIAAAEGIDAAPAHRGIAYAMFENLQLADFGNRIPSLTFEVQADAGAVPVAAIAAEISGGVLADGRADDSDAARPSVGGFAASGDSVRGALESLTAAFPLPLTDDGARLLIGTEAVTTLDPALLGAAADGAAPRRGRSRAAADTLPDTVALGYYEPSRDYQAGLQRARRDGPGVRIERIELAAALAAEEAKALAEGALARRWAGRGTMTARLPWRVIAARAGTRVTIGADGPWRVAGWTWEKMALALELVREHGAGPMPAAATPGRVVGSEDRPAGATVIRLLDLPGLDDTLVDMPQIFVVAAGTGPGWRRAEVSVSLDGGGWQAAGRTALPAIIGTAVGVLGAGPAALFDRINGIEVELLHDGMALVGVDEAALLAGANLAVLGDELIQFGSAVQTGVRRWRLSRLLRGRRGSEWAIGAHGAGESFVLIEPRTLKPLELPLAALGGAVTVGALGPGDDAVAAIATVPVLGRALRPPAPARLTATRLVNGTIRFAWTRRSRAGWAWLDGGDAPLGEDNERYRLEIAGAAGTVRSVELAQPSHDYTPAEQAADGVGTALSATVAQLGTRGASLPPTTASWTL